MGNKTDSPDLALETALLGLNAVFADGGLSETDFEWIRDAVVNLHRAHLAVSSESASVSTEQEVLKGGLQDGLTVVIDISGRRTGKVVIDRVHTTGSGLETYSTSVTLDGEQPRSVQPFMHETMDGPLECIRKALELAEESTKPREPRTN